MLTVLITFAVLYSVSYARPNGVNTLNVATVPPNCGIGQEWVNGICRDIWMRYVDLFNVITVPPNCPAGQEYIGGQCREVWIRQNGQKIEPQNVVTVPPNCPNGQEWVNGECREIWIREMQAQNVVTVPPNCPEGQEYIGGLCRDIWLRMKNAVDIRNKNVQIDTEKLVGFVESSFQDFPDSITDEDKIRNIISVPNQCPNGYKPDANGICREVWD